MKRAVSKVRTNLFLSLLGVSGATIKLDKHGDSEGNFSVLALKKETLHRDNFTCEYQMAPVGQFQQGETLVSEFIRSIRETFFTAKRKFHQLHLNRWVIKVQKMLRVNMI